jgi:hypothetical protein
MTHKNQRPNPAVINSTGSALSSIPRRKRVQRESLNSSLASNLGRHVRAQLHRLMRNFLPAGAQSYRRQHGSYDDSAFHKPQLPRCLASHLRGRNVRCAQLQRLDWRLTTARADGDGSKDRRNDDRACHTLHGLIS